MPVGFLIGIFVLNEFSILLNQKGSQNPHCAQEFLSERTGLCETCSLINTNSLFFTHITGIDPKLFAFHFSSFL